MITKPRYKRVVGTYLCTSCIGDGDDVLCSKLPDCMPPNRPVVSYIFIEVKANPTEAEKAFQLAWS